MGIIDLIKKGVRITNKMLGLVAVYSGYNFLISGVSERFVGKGTVGVPDLQTVYAILTFIILFILSSHLLWAGSCALIRDHVCARQTQLAALPELGLTYFFRVFGFTLVSLSFVLAMMFSFVFVIAAMVILKNPLIIIVFSLMSALAAIITIYAATVISLTSYALVCEDLGIIEAIKKTFRLFKKFFWKITLLSLCVGFVIGCAGMILGMWEKIFETLLGRDAAFIINWIASSFFQGYAGIWTIATFVSFYLFVSQKEKHAAESTPRGA